MEGTKYQMVAEEGGDNDEAADAEAEDQEEDTDFTWKHIMTTLSEDEKCLADHLVKMAKQNPGTLGKMASKSQIEKRTTVMVKIIKASSEKSTCFLCKSCAVVFILGESTASLHGIDSSDVIKGRQKVIKYLEEVRDDCIKPTIRVDTATLGLLYFRGTFVSFLHKPTLWCCSSKLEWEEKARRLHELTEKKDHWIKIVRDRVDFTN